MTYTEALERAKSTPVMRPHWHYVWLTYSSNKYLLLHDDGQQSKWRPSREERNATDWIEAPKSSDPDFMF